MYEHDKPDKKKAERQHTRILFGIIVGIAAVLLACAACMMSRSAFSGKPILRPTATNVATARPLPVISTDVCVPTVPLTAIPPSPTLNIAAATITAGPSGVNIRSGPGIDFSKIGFIEPGMQAKITGKYGEWWQIDYNGTPGWVAIWVVEAHNIETVSEVVPPTVSVSPTLVKVEATQLPTSVPMVPTSVPVCDCSYDRYNCIDFSTHRQAQACYNYCMSLGKGDIHGLDGSDQDGIVCESLSP
jgi:uncharacterized protein YraI